MSDFVLDFGSPEAAEVAFKALGFWDSTNEAPITVGSLTGGGGASFFLKVFGPADGVGYGARLRLNGVDPFVIGLLQIPPGVTVYPETKYLADGVTIDASYAQPPYGQIA